MKVAYYCQHVLGVGHFYRSLEICRTCAIDHQVTMIIGGPDVSCNEPGLSFLQLPGLRMDSEFNSLVPCEPGTDLEEIKRRREEQLLQFIGRYQPDCLIIELYPFGRKAFRFELEPLLKSVRERNTPCRIYCSLRDILVEKTEGLEKFEQRAVDSLNTFFDGLLVHGDREIVTLDQTFGKLDQVKVPVHYTGYVTPKPNAHSRERIRSILSLNPDQKLVVASIGSGSVGAELLQAVVEASAFFSDRENIFLQLFTGPYLANDLFDTLLESQSRLIKVQRFTDDFVDWLGAADLSVSMAGYNTCMNTLAAGVPGLLYPFGQNREQRMRVEKLTTSSSINLLQKKDLAPPQLARLIESTIEKQRAPSPVDLNGAYRTKQIIEKQG
jgi:predicted glycosyltransferase